MVVHRAGGGAAGADRGETGQSTMPQVVTIGEILVEIMATRIGQTFLEPGLFAGPYPSGAPAIFADQAARVGAATAMIGCVGPDDFGTLNLDRLRASGVDVRAIRRVPGTTTGSAFVTYRADGGRDFIYNIANSASAALDAGQLDPGLFAGCRYLHVMGTSLFSASICAAVRRGVELAKAAGAEISFDPNIRKELLALPDVAATIAAVLAVTDLLLPSDADLEHLCPGQAEGEAVRSLLAAGRKIVLLKKGDQGSVFYDAATADRDAGLCRRGGRPDRGRGLLRRHLRRGHGPGRARRACGVAGQRGGCDGGRQEGSDGGQLDHGRARRVPGARPMSELRQILADNRAGAPRGIPSICSAHPLVLEACIDRAVADGGPLLVEATCNQVNQDGGYTGMRAADFRSFVTGLAAARGLAEARLILGGDHLGPNPWRHEPADTAMAKAETLVRSYAAAGFGKLHLDASMACAGDPDPLPPEVIASRATSLCRAAESVAPGRRRLRDRHRGAGARRRARGDRAAGGDAHARPRGDDRDAPVRLHGSGARRGLAAGRGRGRAAGGRVRQRPGGRLRA